MENQFVKMQNINAIVQTHGPKLIIGLVILILGILLTKWIVKFLKNMLGKFIEKDSTVSIICNSTGIILLAFVITASGVEIGAKPGPMISFLMIVCLVAIGIIIIFRPLMPTLPFKVGNTVKAGNILFVSGQNAQKGNEQLTGDITQQTNIALHYLATTLRSHGYGFKDVVDVTVAMAKQSDFAAFNKAYQHYFPNRPARSTALGVLHQDKGVLVEISLVAYK